MPAEHDLASIQAAWSARDHREFVGCRAAYITNAARQFSLLAFARAAGAPHLLDIGCGALGGGPMFLVSLLPERSFGIE